MQTKFEHFATTIMLGAPDSPPRRNAELLFNSEWEARAFGMALALSRNGYFEWEDFRQSLIASISEWEENHGANRANPEWDYYERWLLALERILKAQALITDEEIDAPFPKEP